MPEENAVLFTQDGHIARIVLNRPHVLNALSLELLDSLETMLQKVADNENIRAVIITGAGNKAFSAGADISFLNTAEPLAIRKLAQKAVSINSQIETLGKPVIAAINGYALGGGLELAEACTMRIAVNTSRFGHPEVKIGAVAGWGGTTRLPRLIGISRAADLLLTGRMIEAEEALSIGLINRITEPETLLPAVEKLINEIICNGPLATTMTWEALFRGYNMSIEESTKLGADFFGLIAATSDFREGTSAFLDRRKPSFSGK
jgi:enoyl-CoA hydratase